MMVAYFSVQGATREAIEEAACDHHARACKTALENGHNYVYYRGSTKIDSQTLP